MTRWRWLTAFTALCIASPALAQSGPRLSASLQAGWEYTAGAGFINRSGYAAEGAIAARVAVVHGVGLMVTAAAGAIGASGDVVSTCTLNSRGCQPSVANLRGWTGRIGVERQFSGYIAVSGSIGAGWYDNSQGSGGAHVVPLSVSVILPVVSHAALLGTVELIEFRVHGGDNFRSSALLFGLRVQ